MNSSPKKTGQPLVAGLIAIVLVVIGYAAWTHFHQAHDHAHEPHDHGAVPLSLTLNDGKRWDTDEPLRLGMQRIQDAVAPVLGGQERRKLNPDRAKALADAVQSNVTYLFQNCKLVPKADAVLHTLITELIEGAAMVAANPSSDEGAAKLSHALREYPKYFDHPNWNPLPETKP